MKKYKYFLKITLRLLIISKSCGSLTKERFHKKTIIKCFMGGVQLVLIYSLVVVLVLEISGGGEGFGRGTHYIYWGQGNLRFATMRLRGEKMKMKKTEKRIKMIIPEMLIMIMY